MNSQTEHKNVSIKKKKMEFSKKAVIGIINIIKFERIVKFLSKWHPPASALGKSDVN